ncbi:MAG: flagellar biosynthetic protein FliR [Acidobacteriota bacterium]|nr:flagellar biosynthetic protein FliR [Acidobacteriota bacterium]
MRANLTLDLSTLLAFLLVLARVAGALVFVPLPGVKAAPDAVRAALACGVTLALSGQWPAVDASGVTPARLAGWALGESAAGIAIGVSVAIVLEAFVLAAQVLGLQAGYAYASTVDPNTQADSGILLVFAQLIAGLLFFALGLDRGVLRLFGESLERIPPGGAAFSPGSAQALIRLGESLFSVGMRLALPVVALLILVDVALALLGRINTQLQLLSLAFPAKMLAALLVLSWIAALFPRLLRLLGDQALAGAHQALGL